MANRSVSADSSTNAGRFSSLKQDMGRITPETNPPGIPGGVRIQGERAVRRRTIDRVRRSALEVTPGGHPADDRRAEGDSGALRARQQSTHLPPNGFEAMWTWWIDAGPLPRSRERGLEGTSLAFTVL